MHANRTFRKRCFRQEMIPRNDIFCSLPYTSTSVSFLIEAHENGWLEVLTGRLQFNNPLRGHVIYSRSKNVV